MKMKIRIRKCASNCCMKNHFTGADVAKLEKLVSLMVWLEW